MINEDDPFTSITFLLDQPLTDWNLERLEIQRLSKISNLKIIDLSSFIYPKRQLLPSQPSSDYELIKIKSLYELFLCYSTIRTSALTISFLGVPYEKNRVAYFLLKLFAKKWLVFTVSSFPTLKGNPNVTFTKRVQRKIDKDGLYVITSCLKRLFYTIISFLPFRKPTYFYCIGSFSLKSHKNLVGRNTEIISGKSYDYRNFEEQSAATNLKDYILFIDQQLYSHPDSKDVGFNSLLEDNYLSILNVYLEGLSQATGLPVLFALHPRSGDSYVFKIRNAMRFQITTNTHKYISGAKFCVGHSSTAFSHVALNQKRALFITTNDISKVHQEVDDLAACFGQSPINIENADAGLEESLLALRDINFDAYEKFISEHCVHRVGVPKTLFEFVESGTYLNDV